MVTAMGENDSDAAAKARAAALREEIDRLTKPTADRAKSDGKKSDANTDKGPGKPTNPRDFIHQWMTEHDKKPKE